MTEISSLIKKKWLIILIVLASLMSIYPILQFAEISQKLPLINTFFSAINDNRYILLLIGLLFSIGLIFLKKRRYLAISLIFSILISFASGLYIPNFVINIGIFLPTLIHVYIFTLLFIIYGTLKNKNIYGFCVIFLLIMCPIIIFLMPINISLYKPSPQILNILESSNISFIASHLANVFNKLENETFYRLSEIGIRIQIFISFAYTYHYLNWFSKISIIGWKNTISKRKAVFIACIWAASISLYLYDFKSGIIALFFLSLLHVFLELPLNIVTIKELFLTTKK